MVMVANSSLHFSVSFCKGPQGRRNAEKNRHDFKPRPISSLGSSARKFIINKNDRFAISSVMEVFHWKTATCCHKAVEKREEDRGLETLFSISEV